MMPINLQSLAAEVRTWLDQNIPPDLALPARGEDISPDIEEWTLDFRRKLGAKGWLAPNWPRYLGGGGLPGQAVAVIQQELGRRRLPPLGLEMTWLVPMRVWGTEEQKARWLVPSLQGEITVTQIMSEPSTGADLAHQMTTAVKTPDGYVVNGEKGYTGFPLTPDYLLILITMDPDGPRYQNLGMVILNARDPGVSVRRRTTIMRTTQRAFAFTDVRVPLDDVLGPAMGGWEVAQTLLDVERGGMGVTLDQRNDIERREREYWKPPLPSPRRTEDPLR